MLLITVVRKDAAEFVIRGMMVACVTIVYVLSVVGIGTINAILVRKDGESRMDTMQMVQRQKKNLCQDRQQD